MVRDMLRTLPPRQRAVIVLRCLETVAAEPNLAESAARMRRGRAVTRMARHVDATTHDGRRPTAG